MNTTSESTCVNENHCHGLFIVSEELAKKTCQELLRGEMEISMVSPFQLEEKNINVKIHNPRPIVSNKD